MVLGEMLGSGREGAGTPGSCPPMAPQSGLTSSPCVSPLFSTVGILERRGHREVLGRKKVGYRGVASVCQG